MFCDHGFQQGNLFFISVQHFRKVGEVVVDKDDLLWYLAIYPALDEIIILGDQNKRMFQRQFPDQIILYLCFLCWLQLIDVNGPMRISV